MTQRFDVGSDLGSDMGLDAVLRRNLLARWCTLAEQRLQHLTDLFESGRWRRYYSERAFLENIKEAKKAVETWRALRLGDPLSAAMRRLNCLRRSASLSRYGARALLRPKSPSRTPISQRRRRRVT